MQKRGQPIFLVTKIIPLLTTVGLHSNTFVYIPQRMHWIMARIGVGELQQPSPALQLKKTQALEPALSTPHLSISGWSSTDAPQTKIQGLPIPDVTLCPQSCNCNQRSRQRRMFQREAAVSKTILNVMKPPQTSKSLCFRKASSPCPHPLRDFMRGGRRS